MLKEIIERRSCRNFDVNRMVEDEKINKVVEAGLLAPSGMNRQDSIIIVIKNKETRDRLVKLNASMLSRDSDTFYGAPVILIVANKKTPFAKYDGALVMENMMLEATHLGLGNIWIHRAKEEFESSEMKDILKSLPINIDDYEGVGHLALGYSLVKEYPSKEIKPNRVFKI
ncbi:MAG: nitroreductase [Bacilli bacterium]|nr:nitroreductase [Bacilli bacterium]